MRRTPLYEAHVRLGAKMVDFGGWAMPVSYPTGILEEHRATRTASACSTSATWARCISPARAPPPRSSGWSPMMSRAWKTAGRFYTVACLPSGGIVDDLIVYRLRADHYVAVVNASNIDKDVDWFQEHRGADCKIEDASARDRPDRVPGPGRAAGAAVAGEHSAGPAAPVQPRHRRHRGGAVRLRSPAPATPARTASSSSATRRTPPALWDAPARGGRRQAGRAGRARHAAAGGAPAALRQRPRRRDHAARGGPRLGGQARRATTSSAATRCARSRRRASRAS